MSFCDVIFILKAPGFSSKTQINHFMKPFAVNNCLYVYVSAVQMQYICM